MTYKKIIELPTGVVTEINDRLEGAIKVKYKIRNEFNKPINHIVNVNKKALIKEHH